MQETVTTAADVQPDASTVAAEAEQAGLSVKFNKQTHTLSHEQAVQYAQMGMKYESVEPLLATLKDTAAREGKTLTEWVSGLTERTAPPPADTLAQRLAEEYEALKAFVPQVGDFSQLPDEVVRTAGEQGISLLDAYLRHEHKQTVRIAEEQAAAEAAAARSAGAMASDGGQTASPVEAAMLRGIWGRQ